jgi:hypothetical protein
MMTVLCGWMMMPKETRARSGQGCWQRLRQSPNVFGNKEYSVRLP